jgi:hypothetical protein
VAGALGRPRLMCGRDVAPAGARSFAIVAFPRIAEWRGRCTRVLTMRGHLRRTLLVAAVAGIAVSAYWTILRPWHARWGATADEARRPLPGDDPAAEPGFQTTRAVTIHASALDVWRWVVQLGYGRGGFYSYDWLENLLAIVLRGTPGYRSVDQVLPNLQDLHRGDFIPAAPPDLLGGRVVDEAGWTVERVEPGRVLVLTRWAFVLEPIDDRTTRLIVRTRADNASAMGGPLAGLLFWEPAHFVMERKMLLGIKARAEAAMRRGA